jgi:Rod binding domain-containing protein
MKINSDLSSQPTSVLDARKQAKLVDAAQQFEATMMQELLKPMQHGQDSWGGDEKDGDATFDTLSSFGSETMAKAISKGGGFGIARKVVSQITSQNQQKSEKKTTGY